jgi:hypothetical protein
LFAGQTKKLKFLFFLHGFEETFSSSRAKTASKATTDLTKVSKNENPS